MAQAAEDIVAKVAAGAWRAPMQRMYKLGAIQLAKESGEVGVRDFRKSVLAFADDDIRQTDCYIS